VLPSKALAVGSKIAYLESLSATVRPERISSAILIAPVWQQQHARTVTSYRAETAGQANNLGSSANGDRKCTVQAARGRNFFGEILPTAGGGGQSVEHRLHCLYNI
jgi:hypothetical protein